jgi:hypothetical protein
VIDTVINTVNIVAHSIQPTIYVDFRLTEVTRTILQSGRIGSHILLLNVVMKLSGIQMKRNKEALKFQECISGPRTVLLKADVIMWYVRNAIFYYLKRMQTLRLNRRPLQNAPVFMHHEARAISIYSSPGNQ